VSLWGEGGACEERGGDACEASLRDRFGLGAFFKGWGEKTPDKKYFIEKYNYFCGLASALLRNGHYFFDDCRGSFKLYPIQKRI